MNLRIAFVTSIPSPHQLPLGEALYIRLGETFRMVCTTPMDEERMKLGWKEPEVDLPWLLCTWKSANAQEKLMEILETYDVVIYAAVSTDLVRARICAGGLTFLLMERPFKRGIFLGLVWWFNRLRNNFWPLDFPNHHLLATGAYCARDLSRVWMFSRRQWKWGYFTPVTDIPPPAKPDVPVKLLWAGRMLDWKRVDLLLRAVRCLHRGSKNFSLTLIGDGPEKERLLHFVQQNQMQNYVTFLPPVAVNKVREYMFSSHIYVMPSNYLEGWGAVINEAMAAGCCVVSSNGPGAAPWLIQSGETGYLFNSGNVLELCAILKKLLQYPKISDQIGICAWQNMKSEWSPEIAASRFVDLSLGILGKRPMPGFATGPCSPC